MLKSTEPLWPFLGVTKLQRFGWGHLVRGHRSHEVSYTGFRDFLIVLLQRFLTFKNDTEALTVRLPPLPPCSVCGLTRSGRKDSSPCQAIKDHTTTELAHSNIRDVMIQWCMIVQCNVASYKVSELRPTPQTRYISVSLKKIQLSNTRNLIVYVPIYKNAQ